MPGVGKTWLWDSCIMAFITNYSNGTLSALNNLDNFRIAPNRKAGLKNMLFNGGKVSVVCTKYSSLKNETVIETEAEKPFILRL